MWFVTLAAAVSTSCLSDCSNNGACVNGACECDWGWAGLDCSYRGCPQSCSGRGYCYIGQDYVQCICHPGYNGSLCEIGPPCDEDESEEETQCGGNGVCKDFACFCKLGFTGDDCSQHICPNQCSGHGICNGNSGTCSCDLPHFGAACELQRCQHDCSGHGSCDSMTGMCTCDTGYFGQDCDPRNCEFDCGEFGSCVSSSEAQGHSQCECMEGWGGPACGDRVCKSGYGGKNCDELLCHLGCSGPSHGVCDSRTGMCSCINGWSGTGCQLQLCEDACNQHGACLNGTCQCERGWKGLTCNVPPRVCPNDCSGHGLCDDGKCFCDDNWVMEDCSVRSIDAGEIHAEAPLPAKVCIPACSEHGTCVTNGGTNLCFCEDQWTGLACDTFVGSFSQDLKEKQAVLDAEALRRAEILRGKDYPDVFPASAVVEEVPDPQPEHRKKTLRLQESGSGN